MKKLNKKLIKMLEDSSVEIIFKSRIPYMSMGIDDMHGVINIASIGDHDLTGYNGIMKENLSQETMDKIKTSIVEILKDLEKN